MPAGRQNSVSGRFFLARTARRQAQRRRKRRGGAGMFDLGGVGLLDILPFIAIGFAAQLVDGALGMAFGVIATTLLVIGGPGMHPRAASAAVHTVESFTTGVSGISHILHRNVDWRLFFRIVIPGMIGGIAGAYVLTN